VPADCRISSQQETLRRFRCRDILSVELPPAHRWTGARHLPGPVRDITNMGARAWRPEVTDSPRWEATAVDAAVEEMLRAAVRILRERGCLYNVARVRAPLDEAGL